MLILKGQSIIKKPAYTAQTTIDFFISKNKLIIKKLNRGDKDNLILIKNNLKKRK